ncbi:MAG TPA: GNVR domain-containing protein [bacterium]|nr:GNVR domain-containing protein [bacterium]
MAKMNSRDLKMWWQLLFRGRWYILVSIFLAIAGGLYYAFTANPVYESAATVMIIDTDLLSGSSLRFVPNNAAANTEIDFFRRRITSEDFLTSLIDSTDIRQDPKLNARITQLGYENPHFDREVIARQVYLEYLLTHISTRMRAYNLIEISARAPSSERAFRLASVVTRTAIAESQHNELQTVSVASDFSSQQLDIYRKRLDESENRLNSFRQSMMEEGLSESQLSSEKLTEVQSVKLSTDIDLQSKRDQMQKLLNGPLHDIPLTYRSQLDAEVQEIKSRLISRSQDVCEMLKKFSWKDAEVILLNQEIGQLKKELYERISSTVASSFSGQSPQIVAAAIRLEEVRADVASLQRSSEVLSGIISGHTNTMRRQPSQEGVRTKLERDVQINRQIYEALLQTTQGSQIRESAQVTETKMRFKLISPPQRPLERISPKRARGMFIALVLGCGIGLALVMIRETLDVTIRSVEDVSTLFKIPVLAAIPKIETRLEITRRRHRRYAVAVAIPILAIVSLMLVFRIFNQ